MKPREMSSRIILHEPGTDQTVPGFLKEGHHHCGQERSPSSSEFVQFFALCGSYLFAAELLSRKFTDCISCRIQLTLLQYGQKDHQRID
jgi:hypothetical protein